jgi:hypothetical protein
MLQFGSCRASGLKSRFRPAKLAGMEPVVRFRVVVVCLALLSLVDCGGKGSSRPPEGESGGTSTGGSGGSPAGAGTATAGTATAARCETPTADGYTPTWMPPKVAPHACTAQQISDEYDKCYAKSYDQQSCRAFNVDVANASCLDCMFSALDSRESRAILLLQKAYPVANVGGCIALLDGDSSDDSCGARTQAAGVCQFSACVAACPDTPVPEAEWSACLSSARTGACAEYVDVAGCVALPRYARCQYPTFQEFFNGMGDLFCGAGPPSAPSQGGEGGAGGEAP